MVDKTLIHYPFPQEYTEDYAQKLFAPLVRGECATSVWVATAGRRVLTRFVIDHIGLFENQLPRFQNYLLVYVEPLDLTEESQAGYVRLIGKTFLDICQKREGFKIKFSKEEIELFDDEKANYSEVLQDLKKLLSQVINSGLEVVFFLGEIDELEFITTIFCNNLRSLWNSFDGKLHYVFLIKDVRLIFAKDYFGEELSSLFFQDLFYVPVSEENQAYLMDYFEKKTGYQLTPEKRQIVAEMCDGHPYFLRLAIETLAKVDLPQSPLPLDEVGEVLRNNHEIRAVSRRTFEVQAERAKEVLAEMATGKIKELPDEQSKTLVSLGLVKKDKDGFYQPFCQLFQDAVVKRGMPEVAPGGSQKRLVFDINTNSIIFNDKSVEDQLTRQEYELLSFFLKAPNLVHSRDKIADTLWGKEAYEKYSDWAIDQLVSKLRKKLKNIGLDERVLTTIRGRGYKFTQEE